MGALGYWGLDFGPQEPNKVHDGEFQSLLRGLCQEAHIPSPRSGPQGKWLSQEALREEKRTETGDENIAADSLAPDSWAPGVSAKPPPHGQRAAWENPGITRGARTTPTTQATQQPTQETPGFPYPWPTLALTITEVTRVHTHPHAQD